MSTLHNLDEEPFTQETYQKRISRRIKNIDKRINMSKNINIEDLEGFHQEDGLWDDDFIVNDYKTKIQFYTESNKPVLAIFFDFFNKLSHKRMHEDTPIVNGITIKGILDSDNSFMDNLPEYPPITFTYSVILDFNGILLSIVMMAFKENGSIRNVIRMTSLNEEVIKSGEIYDALFKLAVDNSKLKGSYMTIEDEVLLWQIRTLKDITFNDVYLPESLTEDLSMYVKLFEKKNILQRYMFSGVPGTAKTESTRAITNILNKQGVTVIKTNICKIIKQKFDLAKILAPCVVILDDIDLYLGDRNSTGVSPLLGSFLDILDGIDKLPDNVGVIASTNAPHLIDLAAQRPGRFNKVLFFDELTSNNIVNIIKKSLVSMNEKHDNITEEDVEILTNSKLVDFFKQKGLTGAFIFEAVQDIKNKSETLERKIDLVKTITEISQRNDTLDKKLKVMTIETKLKKSNKHIGY